MHSRCKGYKTLTLWTLSWDEEEEQISYDEMQKGNGCNFLCQTVGPGLQWPEPLRLLHKNPLLRDITTAKDYLVWYNNHEMVLFLEALEKQFSFYCQLGVDKFKDGLSVPELA